MGGTFGGDPMEVRKGNSPNPLMIRFLNLAPWVRDVWGLVFIALLVPMACKNYAEAMKPLIWALQVTIMFDTGVFIIVRYVTMPNAHVFMLNVLGLQRLGPDGPGVTVWDAHAEAFAVCHFMLCFCHYDTRAMPYFVRNWQAPAEHGACLWCEIKGRKRAKSGAIVYFDAVRNLPVASPMRVEYAAAFENSTGLDMFQVESATLRPIKATKHAGAVARMIAAEDLKAAKRISFRGKPEVGVNSSACSVNPKIILISQVHLSFCRTWQMHWTKSPMGLASTAGTCSHVTYRTTESSRTTYTARRMAFRAR
jgi:hypothetical protein